MSSNKNETCVVKNIVETSGYTCKSRRYNSYKGKVGRVAPNRVNHRFNTSIAHQKIRTDTSEFKYYAIDSKGMTDESY